MNTNHKKLLKIVFGVVLLILFISLIKKKFDNSHELKDESQKETIEEVDHNKEEAHLKSRDNKYKDFKEALEEADDPEEFYAGKNIHIDELKKAEKPMVLFFSWENCGPCKEFEPYLYETYQDHPEFIIKNIEVYKNSEFARQYPIRVTPSFVFIGRDGQPFEFSNEIAGKGNFAVYTGEKDEKLFVHEGPVDKDLFQEILNEMENE